MGLYDRGGWLYEAFASWSTLGKLERFRGAAIDRLGIEPGARVLDWGCGTGLGIARVVPHLQGRGEVVGVEVAPAMLQTAVGRARQGPELSFHFVLRDGFGLALREPADVAIAGYSLGTLPPALLDDAVAELWRNLRPGGKLLVLDMYVPEEARAPGRLRTWLGKVLSERLFRQDFSGEVLPAVERAFEREDLVHDEDLMALAFVGRRREAPTPSP